MRTSTAHTRPSSVCDITYDLQCLLAAKERPERQEPSRLPCTQWAKEAQRASGERPGYTGRPHNEQAQVLSVQVSAIVFHVARFFIAFRRQSTSNGEPACRDWCISRGRDAIAKSLHLLAIRFNLFQCLFRERLPFSKLSWCWLVELKYVGRRMGAVTYLTRQNR